MAKSAPAAVFAMAARLEASSAWLVSSPIRDIAWSLAEAKIAGQAAGADVANAVARSGGSNGLK